MVALLIEDDPRGLVRARICAPDNKTATAYTNLYTTWVWVKSYDEFVKYIQENGLPDMYAFDHDLGGNSYDLWHKHGGYKDKEINYDDYDEKTGYHCAKYLVDYCLDNNIRFKGEVYSHSQNTVGRENILGILKNFVKFQDANFVETIPE